MKKLFISFCACLLIYFALSNTLASKPRIYANVSFGLRGPTGPTGPIGSSGSPGPVSLPIGAPGAPGPIISGSNSAIMPQVSLQSNGTTIFPAEVFDSAFSYTCQCDSSVADVATLHVIANHWVHISGLLKGQFIAYREKRTDYPAWNIFITDSLNKPVAVTLKYSQQLSVDNSIPVFSSEQKIVNGFSGSYERGIKNHQMLNVTNSFDADVLIPNNMLIKVRFGYYSINKAFVSTYAHIMIQ